MQARGRAAARFQAAAFPTALTAAMNAAPRWPALAAALLACAAAAAAAAAAECPPGEHAAPVNTFMLSSSAASLAPVDAARALWRLTLPMRAVARRVPYLHNAAGGNRTGGALAAGVLDAHAFLRDWAALSARADWRRGTFPGSCYARAAQCAARGGAPAPVFAGAVNAMPSNALVLPHDAPRGGVADVYEVRAKNGAAELLLRFVDAPAVTPEGRCHPLQGMNDQLHYHHDVDCTHELAEGGPAQVAAGLARARAGVTLFIKLC